MLHWLCKITKLGKSRLRERINNCRAEYLIDGMKFKNSIEKVKRLLAE